MFSSVLVCSGISTNPIPCDVIFVPPYCKTFVCVIVFEVCRTIAICVDRNRIYANRLHMTIEYTVDLAVRNVELLNVSRFVSGVHMFQSRYY